ncbi:NAD(P)H-quinone oxidoreductase [Sulfuritalea hydrogenivorans]|uniref:NAD(P)H quinone oxidoreductase n=1 Tax=Sulfuritalea hydrogenivorans sk43H TaxID=1223802 RepID=W0SEJ3_9PROT|nr:NAD(P)H-quinone oxidoreductase [Sulfuritalea hydrogenivorans]BAO29195.1 NAD(P)H quinone oxidoreductase [Sulfuritalea hydrogenivorans sk43H]
MKYIAHGSGGDADCMTLADGPAPTPGPGQILIEVVCAGVNRPDVLQRSGRYPPPADASPVLGLEVAGRVAALGAGVTEWKVGAGVTALAPGGGYAEYCVAAASHALPIPAGMDFAMAAALPETWFTVWANLVDLGRLAPGERLLVHGGSSGIGLVAIQLAKHLGVECFVTVGNEEKAAFCLGAGAAHAINYRTADFAEEVKRITEGTGVDVILDMVGAPYLQRNLASLRRDGRLVYVAFLEGSKGEADLMPVMLKRLTITGSTMRPRTQAEKTEIRDALAMNIWPALARGELLPHLFARFPLARAAEAHRLMESSRHIGKIVLDVQP